MINSETTTYFVEIPTTITIQVPKKQFDTLTMFNFDDYIEKKIREQIPLYNGHVSIPVEFFDFSQASVVDGY